MQRCMPRLLPPSTWRAMGSMDLRSRALHGPTMELKKCSRGSLREKHPRHWSWNAWSSSRNPSTSHGVRSNCGRENPSSSVRCAGNICCLLVVVCAFGGSVDRENQPVKHRCRCRDKGFGQTPYPLEDPRSAADQCLCFPFNLAACARCTSGSSNAQISDIQDKVFIPPILEELVKRYEHCGNGLRTHLSTFPRQCNRILELVSCR